jgi:colanic acid biosynthesis glycosyl transferase WcaI
MPSKLSGMLASGRPVVAAAEPGSEIARVVLGCGLLVEPENAADFAQAMRALADDAEERLRLGVQARAHAESELGFDGLMARIDARLKSLVEVPPTQAAPAADLSAG